MLKPYKFLVQAIVQHVDDDGNVDREVSVGSDSNGNSFVIFGLKALSDWADNFEAMLAKAEAEHPGGPEGVNA